MASKVRKVADILINSDDGTHRIPYDRIEAECEKAGLSPREAQAVLGKLVGTGYEIPKAEDEPTVEQLDDDLRSVQKTLQLTERMRQDDDDDDIDDEDDVDDDYDNMDEIDDYDDVDNDGDDDEYDEEQSEYDKYASRFGRAGRRPKMEQDDPSAMTGVETLKKSGLARLLSDIGQYNPLSAEDEQRLFFQFREGVPYGTNMERYKKRKKELVENGPEEEYQELLNEEKENKIEAKQLIVLHNMKLVVSNAAKIKSSMDLQDKIMEGYTGLNHAVDKYDSNRKNTVTGKPFKFSTYATYWIKQSIGRAIATKSKTIRMPVHQESRLAKIRNARQEFQVVNGREPTNAEIAETVGEGWSEKDVEKYLSLEVSTVSMEKPVGDDGKTTIEDYISSDVDVSRDHDTYIMNKITAERLRKFITDSLRGEEALMTQVILMRYGYGSETGERRLSYAEISEGLGIPKERVKTLENRGMVILKKEARKRKLEADDFRKL